MNYIADMRKVSQIGRLEHSMTYNVSTASGMIERFILAERLFSLLSTYPLVVVPKFETDSGLESSSISVAERNLRLTLPLDPGTGTSRLPANFPEVLYTKLLRVLYDREFEALTHAPEASSSKELIIDETSPLKLDYKDSFAMFRLACGSHKDMYLIPFGSSYRRLKVNIVDTEKKEPSIELLRTLLALPILVHNLANSLRILQGISETPALSAASINIVPGSSAETKYWSLSKSSTHLPFYLI